MPATFPSTFTSFRPFGSGTPYLKDVPCRLVPAIMLLHRQLRDAINGPNQVFYTHYLDTAFDVDIMDGCSRSVGSAHINYADGDEVWVVTGGIITTFVVFWVEDRWDDEPGNRYRRAYLIRHVRVKSP